MSTAPVAPVAAVSKLNAIEVIERELQNFLKQREQAIANVHAVEGAIQSAQHLRAMLIAEAAKAETFVKNELKAVESLIAKVEPDVAAVVTEVKDNVVAIDSKL